MPTPEEFLQQISTRGLDHLEISASSIPEAKAALQRCQQLQRELRAMKNSINLEIKQLRSHYKEHSSSAGGAVASIFQVFGKRKIAGSIRADAKRRLTAERDRAIQPYETVKLSIDGVLAQIEDGKVQLRAFIDEQRSSSQELGRTASSSSRFCTSCGSTARAEDRFCAKCGRELG